MGNLPHCAKSNGNPQKNRRPLQPRRPQSAGVFSIFNLQFPIFNFQSSVSNSSVSNLQSLIPVSANPYPRTPTPYPPAENWHSRATRVIVTISPRRKEVYTHTPYGREAVGGSNLVCRQSVAKTTSATSRRSGTTTSNRPTGSASHSCAASARTTTCRSIDPLARAVDKIGFV